MPTPGWVGLGSGLESGLEGGLEWVLPPDDLSGGVGTTSVWDSAIDGKLFEAGRYTYEDAVVHEKNSRRYHWEELPNEFRCRGKED